MRSKNMKKIRGLVFFILLFFMGNVSPGKFVVLFKNGEMGVYCDRTYELFKTYECLEYAEKRYIFNKKVNFIFNPYNSDIFCLPIGMSPRLGMVYGIWNLSQELKDEANDKPIFLPFNFNKFAFSCLQPNLIAFENCHIRSKLSRYRRVKVHDILLKKHMFRKNLGWDDPIEALRFNEDGDLMFLQGETIEYHKIGEEEGFKKSNFKKPQDCTVADSIFLNRYKEEVVCFKTRVGIKIVNIQRGCSKSYHNEAYIVSSDKDLIVILDSEKNLCFFDITGMCEIFRIKDDSFLGIKGVLFQDHFIFTTYEGIRKISVVKREEIESILIPTKYSLGSPVLLQIKKERQYFIVGMCNPQKKDSRIVFYDSRTDSWREFVDDRGREIAKFGFFPDPQEESLMYPDLEQSDLEERVQFLVDEFDGLTTDAGRKFIQILSEERDKQGE